MADAVNETVAGYGGVSLACQRWGDPADPSVVLVHGLGQSRHVWEGTARDLAAAGRHVVAFDLRGHGDSGRAPGGYRLSDMVEDLRNLLSSLSDRPVLVGASAGGWLAAMALGEGGAHFASGLILVDTPPTLGSDHDRWVGEALRSHRAGFATLEEAGQAAAALHPRRDPAEPGALARRLRTGDDGRLYWNWDLAVLDAFGADGVEARFRQSLQRVTVPIFAIHGEASEIMTPAMIAQLQSLAPTMEVGAIEGAGHLVVSERGEAFNGVLLEFLERRFPRSPVTYVQGSDPRTLRDALGCFATGVTVVTTRTAEGEPIGLTANSFTSVSLDPPLILVCVAKSAGSAPVLETAEHFAINMLHIGQQPTSDRFARRGEDRFAATAHEGWDTGVPILSGALASFECSRHALHDGGDHYILVGLVTQARFEPKRDPLLYFRGKYRRLHFG